MISIRIVPHEHKNGQQATSERVGDVLIVEGLQEGATFHSHFYMLSERTLSAEYSSRIIVYWISVYRKA